MKPEIKRAQWRWIIGCWVVLFAVVSTLAADDEKTAPNDDSVKQKIHKLTESAQSAKDFSQIIDQCQTALGGELSESDRAYLKTLKSWALNRRCEKRIELAVDFAAAKNDRQARLVRDQALADAIAAIGLDESRWRAYLNRGILLSDAGLFREALADFQTVCRLQPQESAGWFNGGEMFSALKQFEAAIASYDRAIEIDSADLQALTGRGLARCRLGDFENGLTDFQIVAKMQASDPATHLNCGDAHLGLAQWRDALDDYNRAAGINDDGVAAARTAWLMATCPEAEFYQPETAIDLARHSIEKGGETVTALEALAAAHACKGEFDQAVQAQRKAVELDDNADVARAERLKMYEEQKPFVLQVHRVGQGVMRTSTPALDEPIKE